MTVFGAEPGRETYDVVLADAPVLTAGVSAMTKIFGLPVDDLTVVLTALLVLALAAIAVLALRNRVFFRLGIRSLTRRRGRTALIVVG